jgi:hypothetical protein
VRTTTLSRFGFEVGPNGTWLFCGWAVFGHILPRIGFHEHPCTSAGEPLDELDEDIAANWPHFRTVFAIEWLGDGLAIWGSERNVR